jgi:squalene synthase HpnC
VSEALSSGKGHRDENFPVASRLIDARHREPVMAFYRVARLADDIADHTAADADDKLARLAAIEASLTGAGREVEAAVRLRAVMIEREISSRHILDLLEAFRRDVTKTRYADWGELMDYCRYSAAPVGRYVLEVHGESVSAWTASDALCAALQVINHLQDCGEDYRALDRVYVPLDALGGAGLEVAALGAPAAAPHLRAVITALAERTLGLLEQARPLAGEVGDQRLRMEIGAIHTLAVSLARRLTVCDPLSQRVHHRPIEAFGLAVLGAVKALGARQNVKPAP